MTLTCPFTTLRTLREYYVRAAADDLERGQPVAASTPEAHPGIWIGVADMDHILRHALNSQNVRLSILEKRLNR